jgi:hypothetical protein
MAMHAFPESLANASSAEQAIAKQDSTKMPKTRRTKKNVSPKTIYGQHSAPFVVEQGLRLGIAGIRSKEGEKQIPAPKAKPVFIGRQYTGQNKGKVYPYASTKRGAVK